MLGSFHRVTTWQTLIADSIGSTICSRNPISTKRYWYGSVSSLYVSDFENMRDWAILNIGLMIMSSLKHPNYCPQCNRGIIIQSLKQRSVREHITFSMEVFLSPMFFKATDHPDVDSFVCGLPKMENRYQIGKGMRQKYPISLHEQLKAMIGERGGEYVRV